MISFNVVIIKPNDTLIFFLFFLLIYFLFNGLENHRTQSQFDRHRVTKLVLFEFVNNFMSLFYIAFIIQDMELLRYVSVYVNALFYNSFCIHSFGAIIQFDVPLIESEYLCHFSTKDVLMRSS